LTKAPHGPALVAVVQIVIVLVMVGVDLAPQVEQIADGR